MCPAATSVEEGGLDSLADLVLDLSSVIVERSGLLPALLPVDGTPRRHAGARAGNLSRPLIGPHVLNTDLMVQEETYEALLLVRQQDRDGTMVRKSGNLNIG